MKKKHDVKGTLFLGVMITLFIIVIGGLIATEIYVWTTYGGKSVSEIPLWALFFMFGRR